MDDKPERRSSTYYFPGAFRYFIIYIYTTDYKYISEADPGKPIRLCPHPLWLWTLAPPPTKKTNQQQRLHHYIMLVQTCSHARHVVRISHIYVIILFRN